MAYKYAKGKVYRGDIYNEDDTQRNTFIDFSEDAVGIIVGNAEGLVVSGSGAVSSSLNVSASGFYGDGSGLSNVTATSSPAGSDGQLQYNNGGSTGGTANFYWSDSNNRLGIGTSTPSASLEIKHASSAVMQFSCDDGRMYSVGSDGYGFIIHDETTSDVSGYRLVISDREDYMGYVGIGDGVSLSAQAHPKALLHLSSSDDQALFRVDTTGGNTATTVLFATGSGRVGIGTSSPDTTLHIEGTGDGSMWEALRITNTGGTLNDDSAIYFTHYTDDRLQAFIKDDVGSGWDTKLHFGTADNSNTAATKMTLDGDGKLGIGTETPDYTLDVAGNIGLDEYIYHNGDANTFIRFQTDDITIKAGNVNFISATSASQNTKLIVNDGREDSDFIVRSPSENLALYLNAGNEVFHINHGESSFKTKIHSTNGEAITVNNNGVILNEDGSGVNDFRVESTGSTHMLFVAANKDRVGIGTNDGKSTFQISGSQGGNYTQTAGNITFTETHYIVDYTGAGNATFTLPDVSDITGRIYHILSHAQQEDDTLTITGSGGQFQGSSLEGDANSVDISGWTPQSITVVSTGGNWFILTDNRAQEH